MSEQKAVEHLRLVPAALLGHYFVKRAEPLAFYRRVRRRGQAPPVFTQDYVLFHSWLPGFLELDTASAEPLKARMCGHADVPLEARLASEVARLGWATPAAPDIERLVEKAFTVFPAIQNPKELRAFLVEVARIRPRTVLEIGTGAGGLLYCLAQLADAEATLVTVDAPEAAAEECPDELESELFPMFAGPRKRIIALRGCSFHASTKQAVAAVLEGRKVDLLVIDGDHSYDVVRSDFEMYREFVSPEATIVFHDILMFPETWGSGFDVGILWRELKQTYATREIIDTDAPIRPPSLEQAARLGMPGLGFGLLFQNGAEYDGKRAE